MFFKAFSLSHFLPVSGVRRAIGFSSVRSGTSRLSRLVVLGVTLVASSMSLAQVATVDFSAKRDFVFQNGDDPFLELITRVDNPTTSVLASVVLTYVMPEGVDLSSVDSECVEAVAAGNRTVTCTFTNIAAGAFRNFSFLVDGPNSIAAGPSFTITLGVTGGPTVIPATPDESSLADGDRTIRGTPLTIHVVRNLAFDGNQNNIPDVDESIIGFPNLPTADRLKRDAVIDLMFIYSPAAEQYLDGQLEQRIEQLVNAANQTFRDNGIGVIFNAVGLEEVNYTTDDPSITQTNVTLSNRADNSLLGVDNFLASSGGDIVVFLHALDATTPCGASSAVAINRQGDFQPSYHRGRLSLTVDVGPTCVLSVRNISALIGTAMGLVNSRQSSPNGGTYSFSAGFGKQNDFSTIMTQVGTSPFGAAQVLNEFSSPSKTCKNETCGLDSADLALGADAVKSLQLTRHVVSALSNTVFSIDPTMFEEKRTLVTGVEYPVTITQKPLTSGGFATDFIPFEVSIQNQSQVTLRSLLVNVLNIHNQALNTEAQNYQVAEGSCAILGPLLTTQGTTIDGTLEKSGTPHCFIDSVADSYTQLTLPTSDLEYNSVDAI